MRTAFPLLVGLILLVVLTWFCAMHMQNDAQATAEYALTESGHAWAVPVADGRWIVLTGEAPGPASLEQASEVTLAQDAVTRVINGAGLRAVTADDLTPVRGGLAREGLDWVDLSWQDRTLELSGVASAQDDRERAEAVSAPLWPWGPIQNDIEVAETAAGRRLLACRTSLDQLLDTQNVNFETDSSALTAADRALLNQMVTILDDCPETRIRVEAHSDNTGDADYNLTLSRDRAQSVVTYLVGRGLSVDRFESEGYGESRPLADNNTEEGRALNRRVEFRFSL